MQNIGLSQVLAPMAQDDFFRLHWPNKYLFIPLQKNKLASLLSLPQLQSLEAVVTARQLKVRACLPDLDDEYSSIHLEPKDALKAYRNNMTLVFDSMHLQDSTIAAALQQVRMDLGLVTGGPENDLCKARSIVYATPAGGGTSLHFDANANFVIQLQGSKRWLLAPNKSVKNPTERFSAGAGEMPAALEKQCHDQLIDELPEDCIEVIMEPGCVLFVPRGYWHSTSTEEDSLSLNFTFSQPSWADVFTRSMQELLLSSSEWRELADGLEAKSGDRKERAIARFEVLVRQLAEELPQISGRQLLSESGLL